MVGNRARNQQGLHLVGQHAVTCRLTQRQGKTVGKQKLLARHPLNNMAFQVRQASFFPQVVLGTQGYRRRLAGAGLVSHMRRTLLGGAAHLLQQQGLRHIRTAADRIHRNSLDQPLAEGLQAIERVNQVPELIPLEGRTKTQAQNRVELGQILSDNFPVKAVWLINDQDRTNRRKGIHEAFCPAKEVGLHATLVDDFVITRKRLVSRHHHRNARVRRVNEPLDRLVRIIENADFLVLVFLGKKRRCRLQGLQCALTNGVARHQHDELGQFVFLVQPMNGLDESKGLARSRLHQHIQRQGRGQSMGDLHRTGLDTVFGANPFNIAPQGIFRLVRQIRRVGMHIARRDKAHIGKDLKNAVDRTLLVSQSGVLELGAHAQPRKRSLSSERFSVSSRVLVPSRKLSSCTQGA